MDLYNPDLGRGTFWTFWSLKSEVDSADADLAKD